MSTTTWTQQSGMDSDNDVETINDAPDGSGNSTTWTQGAGMDSATDEVDLADYADQASSSADAASARAAEAATSASTATSQAASAATYATIAQGHSDDASTAKTAAETAKTAAETAETNAETAETNASASATNASTSATNAATSATSASTSASTATTKASEASTSASNAQASADAALAALDNFDDRYLGAKASDPTVDNDGDALVAGALYFNTTDDVMKVYEGSSWVAAYASLSGALLSANNLSDLGNASSARTNLGLGTAATTASTDYATAAQGTKADTAHGWGDHSTAGYAASSHTHTLSQITDAGTAAASATTDFATAAQGTLADSAVQPNDSPTFAGLTTTGNASFGDNDKAIFGAWSDLQIYHDGLNSYIQENGTGNLRIRATDLSLEKNAGGEYYLQATADGAVRLYYDASQKLATTSTGIYVTGTVTATSFSGDGSNLTGIDAGATGGGSDKIFWENDQTVTTDYTITNNQNAMSAGPITINSGITVTVGAGETWTVV